jgi:hypothetical protein
MRCHSVGSTFNDLVGVSLPDFQRVSEKGAALHLAIGGAQLLREAESAAQRLGTRKGSESPMSFYVAFNSLSLSS